MDAASSAKTKHKYKNSKRLKKIGVIFYNAGDEYKNQLMMDKFDEVEFDLMCRYSI